MTERDRAIQAAVREHVARQWLDRALETVIWERGSIQKQMPHFRVIEIAPLTDDGPWIYVTAGS